MFGLELVGVGVFVVMVGCNMVLSTDFSIDFSVLSSVLVCLGRFCFSTTIFCLKELILSGGKSSIVFSWS